MDRGSIFKLLRWLLVLIIFIANISVWYSIFQNSGRVLSVSFLNVGQGDAILIRAPLGQTVLIDGGPGKVVLGRLAAALPYFSRSLDLVLETHPDTDHVGGLPDVVSRYAVRGVMKPCIGSSNPYDQALDARAKEREIPIICAMPGQLIDLGNGAKMEILYAGQKTGISEPKTNDASIVAKLSYGDSDFLFTGDTTEAVEKYLSYTEGKRLDSEVYKVAHHGSKTSSGENFLKLVSPEVSVISVGAKNTYGHPHGEVLDRLTSLKSVILRTDQLGAIILESDGASIKIK